MKPILKMIMELGFLKAAPPDSAIDPEEGVVRSLARLKLIDEGETLRAIAKRLSLPFIDLDDVALLSKLQTDELVKKYKPGIFYQNKAAPLYEEEGVLVIALGNPLDHDAIRVLEFAVGAKFKMVVAEERKILRLVAGTGPATPTYESGGGASIGESAYVEIIPPDKDEVINIHTTEAPQIVKICNKIIADAVRWNGSDIHIEPSKNAVDVRVRIDGVMHSVFELPRRIQPNITSRLKILAGMDISERRRPQDGRIRTRISGQNVDIRVSSIPVTYGEKLVLRLLYADSQSLTLASLGILPKVEAKLKRHLDYRGKLILVTGPTGSGKTTTLYACLNHLKDGKSNIQTVEDPIEYCIAGINQVQVNEAINVNFASALRSILRQDPDVIMIGEIRDQEAGTIAFQAAQTGHLVLSTLHTNSAAAAISRLANMGVEPFVMSSALAAILSQRLVRKICSGCCASATEEYIGRNKSYIDAFKLNPTALKEGRGCDLCNFTGYKGRISLVSYFEVTPKVAQLIHDRATLPELVEEAKKGGYVELSRVGMDAVGSGITTIDEIKAHVESSELEIKEASTTESVREEDMEKRTTTKKKKTKTQAAAAPQAPAQPQPIPPQPVAVPVAPHPQYQQVPQPYPPQYQQPMPAYGTPMYPPPPQQPMMPYPAPGYAPVYPQPGYVPPQPYMQPPTYGVPPQMIVPQPMPAPMPPPQPTYVQPEAAEVEEVEEEEEEQEDVSEPVKKGKRGAIEKKKIVLVEDHPDLANLVTLKLESDMYDVVHAVDGNDGLRKVYEHSPDIILCDLMMPGLDGREFLKRIKANENTRDIPVVMLTASDAEENEVDLLSLGAADFVSKSSSTEVLLARVRKACR